MSKAPPILRLTLCTHLQSFLGTCLELFEKNRAIIDYLDTSEEESALIATKPADIKMNKYYTHCEIDPSLILGVMGNSIIYPESNQFPRDCFSCGQSRQAVSVYHSNYQMRMERKRKFLIASIDAKNAYF